MRSIFLFKNANIQNKINIITEEIYKNIDFKNTHIGKQILNYTKSMILTLETHVGSEVFEEIYQKITLINKENKIDLEFNNRNLNSYFSNILEGNSIDEKLAGVGLEQRRRMAFFRIIYVFTGKFEKSKPKEVYALLGFIYSLDCQLAAFQLLANRIRPSYKHYVKKLLLLWVLIKEKLIENIAEQIINISQLKLIGTDIEQRKKWSAKAGVKELKEKIQVNNLVSSWAEKGNCSFFVTISESTHKKEKRFDGLLIVMPDIYSSQYILTPEGKRQSGKYLGLVKMRENFLANLFAFRRIIMMRKEDNDKPLLGVKFIEATVLIFFTYSISLFKVILKKQNLLSNDPFGQVNTRPVELKTVESKKKIKKRVKEGIIQLRNCGVSSGAGSLAIQLTDPSHTKEIVVEAVGNAFRDIKDNYDIEIVVFPPFDKTTGEYLEPIYQLNRSNYEK
ncbi:hypothetical protein [Nostoc parmelioides]|uniref:Uncharacterized protein n=1 Tax=Nostoc parmelioides FACHB-3921 TaxID=2692909 RepID=A0ABR8BMZ4_9NOSO|nr:hypothetical protein [Nostoc parmelioides]MBD2255256.1 hypothetical protein [Nostoc parmelioides FACHB-3921]